MSGLGLSLTLLIDTHVLIWAMNDSRRLSKAVRDRLIAPGQKLLISAITAWEYVDLHQRGRLPAASEFGVVSHALAAEVLTLPADLWRLATMLPDLHRDPVDRMLIAHAILADLTLVTADSTMRAYPVRSLR